MATETKKLEVQDYKDAEPKPAKVKDPILEARRILKRLELLEKPEQRLVLEKLTKMVGEEG